MRLAIAFIYASTLNRYSGQVYSQNVMFLTPPIFLTFFNDLLLYGARPRPSCRLVASNQWIRYVSNCSNTRSERRIIFVSVGALFTSTSLPIASTANIIIVASVAQALILICDKQREYYDNQNVCGCQKRILLHPLQEWVKEVYANSLREW